MHTIPGAGLVRALLMCTTLNLLQAYLFDVKASQVRFAETQVGFSENNSDPNTTNTGLIYYTKVQGYDAETAYFVIGCISVQMESVSDTEVHVRYSTSDITAVGIPEFKVDPFRPAYFSLGE